MQSDSRRFFLKQRHIALLLALNTHEHLGAAAEQLHMSQPAASKALAALEEQLGYTLFERSSTGTQATALGKLVIDYALRLQGAASRMQSELLSIHEKGERQLRIGMLPSASITLVPKLIHALQDRSLQLEITLHEGLLHDLVASLLRNELDCVIGRHSGRLNHTQIQTHFLYEDPVTLLCGIHSPLTASNTSLEQIMRSPWILPLSGSVLNERVEEMFGRFGVTPPVCALRSNAMLANIDLINQNPWVTALPRVIAQTFQEQQRVHILPIDTRINFGDVQLMLRKETQLSLPVQWLLEELNITAATPQG